MSQNRRDLERQLSVQSFALPIPFLNPIFRFCPVIPYIFKLMPEFSGKSQELLRYIL